MKDGINIPGADSSVFTISSVAHSDSGLYHCQITNSIATDLTLYSRPVRVRVYEESVVADPLREIPSAFSLHQNYPNPFNPSTKIQFHLPKLCHFTLKVYDILGREIETILEGTYPADVYEIEWKAEGLASGIYLYRLEAGNFIQTKKLIFQK